MGEEWVYFIGYDWGVVIVWFVVACYFDWLFFMFSIVIFFLLGGLKVLFKWFL